MVKIEFLKIGIKTIYNRNTLIAVPHGRDKAEYLAQWNKQYQRYTSRE